jgi:hypothetical protein
VPTLADLLAEYEAAGPCSCPESQLARELVEVLAAEITWPECMLIDLEIDEAYRTLMTHKEEDRPVTAARS